MKKDLTKTATPADLIRAENELLKLKLETEHKMVQHEASSTLPPEVENEFLRNVYQFEQQFSRNKQISVYDFLGRPEFKMPEALSPVEIPGELERIKTIMEEKGLCLDMRYPYDEATVYRFITGELFSHEIDDIRIPGMVHHLIYEEFHPNHEGDLREKALEFIESILRNQWSRAYDCVVLANEIVLHGKSHSHEEIVAIITEFKAACGPFGLKEFNIREVRFDLATARAVVEADIVYVAGDRRSHRGPCRLNFKLEWDFWSICEFDLPGF